MRKKLPQILILIFLFILIAGWVSAVQAITYQPKITLPGGPSGNIDENSIGQYISALYKYAIGIVGILATVALMFGGIIWITAGGSSERMGSAKAWIGGALTGLILVFSSYMILKTINPDLVTLKPIKLVNISETKKCCSEKLGSFSGFTNNTGSQITYSCTPVTDEQKNKYGSVQECAPDKSCTKIDNSYKCTGRTDASGLCVEKGNICRDTCLPGEDPVGYCDRNVMTGQQVYCCYQGNITPCTGGQCRSVAEGCLSGTHPSGKYCSNPTEIAGQIICCMPDTTPVASCASQPNGTPCTTDSGGHGYCDDSGNCQPCIAPGGICTNNIINDYQCAKSTNGTCGFNNNEGNCVGNWMGACSPSCTCK